MRDKPLLLVFVVERVGLTVSVLAVNSVLTRSVGIETAAKIH